MTPALTESDLENIVLGWFGELGYTIFHGQEIAPETPQAERSSYSVNRIENYPLYRI